MSKQTELQQALESLRIALPDLRGAMIASVDGLPIVKSFADGVDANRVAAMAATALGLGKRIGDTLGTGELNETSVSGTDGQVFIYTAGKKGVLAIVAPAGTNVGLLHMEARDMVETIKAVL